MAATLASMATATATAAATASDTATPIASTSTPLTIASIVSAATCIFFWIIILALSCVPLLFCSYSVLWYYNRLFKSKDTEISRDNPEVVIIFFIPAMLHFAFSLGITLDSVVEKQEVDWISAVFMAFMFSFAIVLAIMAAVAAIFGMVYVGYKGWHMWATWCEKRVKSLPKYDAVPARDFEQVEEELRADNDRYWRRYEHAGKL